MTRFILFGLLLIYLHVHLAPCLRFNLTHSAIECLKEFNFQRGAICLSLAFNEILQPSMLRTLILEM